MEPSSNNNANTPKTIILIRAGHSLAQNAKADNKSRKRDPSLRDASLSSKGLTQATELPDSFDISPIDLVVVSPLTRAIQTGALVFAKREDKVKIVVHYNIRELGAPNLENRPRAMEEVIGDIYDQQNITRVDEIDTLSQLPPSWPKAKGREREKKTDQLNDFRAWLNARSENVICVVCHSDFILSLLGRGMIRKGQLSKIENCCPICCYLNKEGKLTYSAGDNAGGTISVGGNKIKESSVTSPVVGSRHASIASMPTSPVIPLSLEPPVSEMSPFDTKKVILIRHGNSLGQIAKSSGLDRKTDPTLIDASLSPKGIIQATELPSTFDIKQCELIVVSPLTRAMQTACMIFAEREDKVKIIVNYYIREIGGRTIPENLPRAMEDVIRDISSQDNITRVSEIDTLLLKPSNWPELTSRRINGKKVDELSDFKQWLTTRSESVICVVCHHNVIFKLLGRGQIDRVDNCSPIHCVLDFKGGLKFDTGVPSTVLERLKERRKMIWGQIILTVVCVVVGVFIKFRDVEESVIIEEGL